MSDTSSGSLWPVPTHDFHDRQRFAFIALPGDDGIPETVSPRTNQLSSLRNTMQTIEFELEGDYVELNMLLKLCGLCDSGGAGKKLVASGTVSVDSQIEWRKTCKIHAGQTVHIGDIEIHVLADARAG